MTILARQSFSFCVTNLETRQIVILILVVVYKMNPENRKRFIETATSVRGYFYFFHAYPLVQKHGPYTSNISNKFEALSARRLRYHHFWTIVVEIRHNMIVLKIFLCICVFWNNYGFFKPTKQHPRNQPNQPTRFAHSSISSRHRAHRRERTT